MWRAECAQGQPKTPPGSAKDVHENLLRRPWNAQDFARDLQGHPHAAKEIFRKDLG